MFAYAVASGLADTGGALATRKKVGGGKRSTLMTFGS